MPIHDWIRVPSGLFHDFLQNDFRVACAAE